MKSFFAAIVVVFLVFSLVAPVLAEESFMIHTSTYYADGKIDLKKQAGHLCNTGAEMKQLIDGYGLMVKSSSIHLVEGKLVLDDQNTITSKPGGIRPLTVSTAYELCTPPKGEYLETEPELPVWFNYHYRWDTAPLEDEVWQNNWHLLSDGKYYFQVDSTDYIHPADINAAWEGNYTATADIPGQWWSLFGNFLPYTSQIWAASITPDPGKTGYLNNQLTASHRYNLKSDDYEDYVLIDQQLYNPAGIAKRYIDISSSWSHAFLTEDMQVTGKTQTDDRFTLWNSPTGSKNSSQWWLINWDRVLSDNVRLAEKSYLEHVASYTAEGTIDFKKQAGHRCNTGAEMKQLIFGEGYLSKNSDIFMVLGLLSVNDENEIFSAEDALRNMSVASSIELCAPPKRIFTAPTTVEYFPSGMLKNIEDEKYLNYSFAKGDAVPPHLSYLFPYLLGEEDKSALFEAISKQIWAASIVAEPGYGAVLNHDFTAAYGPYSGEHPLDGRVSEWYNMDIDGNIYINLRNYPWDFDMDSWWLSYWQEGLIPVIGNQFVGNYFTIEQYLSNTQGVSKRFIDISSPWNHGYLYEDMLVIGKAEVRETFEMLNLPAGSDNPTDWWSIGRTESRKTHKPLYDEHLAGTLTDYQTPTYFLGDNIVEMISGPVYMYYLPASTTWTIIDPDYIPGYDEGGADLSAYTEFEQNLIRELWSFTTSPSSIDDGSEVGLTSRLFSGYINPYLFVGNYFSTDQQSRLSSGGLLRYIDLSNPFAYDYLMEDMSITGKSEIKKTFTLSNIPVGSDSIFNFWNLF